MDVDGTLTDGKIYISNSGDEMKSFNIKDGYAIKEILPRLNIIPVIITGRKSKIVEIRAKELNIIEVYQGVENKLGILEYLKEKYKISDNEIAFIGDDFNDVDLFNRCYLTACPADATRAIKDISKIVLATKGGEGAVQEFILRIYEEIKNESYR
jgi:3-deoxy-D-manno-octulosonate 8-phosphate phosphatase (KDO 8-P phosphatase)